MAMDLNRLAFAYGVYFPVLYARREPVKRYLAELSETQWTPRAALEDLQRRKLERLLHAARTHVPFYRDRIHDDRQPLSSVPFLRKADLQASATALCNAASTGPFTIKTTGGSTGQAVTVRKSRDATARETAAQWRGFGWAGVRVGDRQARFWGVPFAPRDRLRARLADVLGNRRRCSAFAFTEADLARYTRMLNAFQPRYLYGYVSMIEQYAQYVIDRGIDLAYRPVAVITTSEVLTPTSRQRLQDAFGCRVFNEYGCGELGTIAHECERGQLHVNAENLVVEVLDGERPCAAGETGEIVVTELNNTAMPLIRYRLGDFGALSDSACECGRTLPVLETVVGRGYDLVYNREGRMFHGEFFMYMFEEARRRGQGVKAFQVVQESYDRFTIRIVPGDGYGEGTREIVRTRVREGYGADVEIAFVEVDEIARRASGKMQLIVGMTPLEARA